MFETWAWGKLLARWRWCYQKFLLNMGIRLQVFCVTLTIKIVLITVIARACLPKIKKEINKYIGVLRANDIYIIIYV